MTDVFERNPERAGSWRDNACISETDARAYRSYVPSPLPPAPEISFTPRLLRSLTEAHSALGLLDGLITRTGGSDALVSFLVKKESLASSCIEGLKATFNDVASPYAGGRRTRDTVEVLNGITASITAIKRIQERRAKGETEAFLPVINESHWMLFASSEKNSLISGRFREKQVWIGKSGSPRNAVFVPPNVADMKESLKDLEEYMGRLPEFDALIEAALIHYQFETIHPYSDGNGRTGRLLTVLYLLAKGAIANPCLVLSPYFLANRADYYDSLSTVRKTGNYEQWIRFFLDGVAQSAASVTAILDRLAELRSFNEELLSETKNPPKVRKRFREFLRFLESEPVADMTRIAEAMKVSFQTATRMTDEFIALGILKESTGQKRGRLFAYEAYLAFLKEDFPAQATANWFDNPDTREAIAEIENGGGTEAHSYKELMKQLDSD